MDLLRHPTSYGIQPELKECQESPTFNELPLDITRSPQGLQEAEQAFLTQFVLHTTHHAEAH